MALRERSTFPVVILLVASVLLAVVTALPEIAAAQAPAASGSSRPPALNPATEGSAVTVLRGSRPFPQPQIGESGASPDYAGDPYDYGYWPDDDYGYWPFGFDNGFSGRGRHRFSRNRFARRPFPARAPNLRAHIARGFAAAHIGGFGRR
jgi:hypothetical protein